jgi:diadenosine tetraphosphate (Ap4A) HIT family hydrolase
MHAATVERAFKRLPMDFSQIPKSAWKASNSLAFAFRDRYPVSRGHTLIVPHRVVPTWFEATRGEQVAILELLDVVKAQLDAELQPQGYNVGFNAGEAAGQTVAHLHLHVIPRYAGDMEDPTGGVRHVRPGMGNYRRQREDSLLTGGTQAPLLRAMRPLLRAAQEVDIVAAFVQDSGLRALEEDLSIALLNGAQVRLICGDYLDITQKHALQRRGGRRRAGRGEGGTPCRQPAGESRRDL